MKVSLIRKLWKQKVQLPVLHKRVDKILGQIDVKLKQRSKNERSKRLD